MKLIPVIHGGLLAVPYCFCFAMTIHLEGTEELIALVGLLVMTFVGAIGSIVDDKIAKLLKKQ